MATRAQLTTWMAAQMDLAANPWDAAGFAFQTVLGREGAGRWDATQPADAAIEDALVCWDIDLMVEAMGKAGFSPCQIENA